MQNETCSRAIVPVTNLTEFFRSELREVLAHQRVAVEDETERYVVNMLTLFARSDVLYESTPDGPRLKPLVEMLFEALHASTSNEHSLALQRLGDVSLFMAGFFARSFARHLVDVDYHIAMGCRAYGSLAHSYRRSHSSGFGEVFAELAAKFQSLVDVLGEISDEAHNYPHNDILRLYEIWLKTGSVRARVLLRRLGVEAAPVALRTH